jgi:hypothetical protein
MTQTLLILHYRSEPIAIQHYEHNIHCYESMDFCHQQLLSEHKLLAKKRLEKDTRIAAIALANEGILVTRNYKDFSLIPNLQIEDWTT